MFSTCKTDVVNNICALKDPDDVSILESLQKILTSNGRTTRNIKNELKELINRLNKSIHIVDFNDNLNAKTYKGMDLSIVKEIILLLKKSSTKYYLLGKFYEKYYIPPNIFNEMKRHYAYNIFAPFEIFEKSEILEYCSDPSKILIGFKNSDQLLFKELHNPENNQYPYFGENKYQIYQIDPNNYKHQNQPQEIVEMFSLFELIDPLIFKVSLVGKITSDLHDVSSKNCINKVINRGLKLESVECINNESLKFYIDKLHGLEIVCNLSKCLSFELTSGENNLVINDKFVDFDEISTDDLLFDILIFENSHKQKYVLRNHLCDLFKGVTTIKFRNRENEQNFKIVVNIMYV